MSIEKRDIPDLLKEGKIIIAKHTGSKKAEDVWKSFHKLSLPTGKKIAFVQ
jgi:hypothetical protein